MAAFVKFNSFVEALAEKKHDLSADQITIALTNVAPNPATAVNLADITQISYTNLSSRNVTTVSSSQTGGVYALVLTDLILVASGDVGPFRYAVIYNSTSAGGLVIGYADYGSSVSLATGEPFTIDFDPAGAVTLG